MPPRGQQLPTYARASHLSRRDKSRTDNDFGPVCEAGARYYMHFARLIPLFGTPAPGIQLVGGSSVSSRHPCVYNVGDIGREPLMSFSGRSVVALSLMLV